MNMTKLRSYILVGFITLIAMLPAIAKAAETIEKVRFGQHPDKVRLVIEMSGTQDFAATIRQNPTRLEVTLPLSNWNETGQSKNTTTLFNETSYQSGTEQSTLTFGLNKPARILGAFLIPAGDGKKNARLVIDVREISSEMLEKYVDQPEGTLTPSQPSPQSTTETNNLDFAVTEPSPNLSPVTTSSNTQSNQNDMAPIIFKVGDTIENSITAASKGETAETQEDVATEDNRPNVIQSKPATIVIDPGHGGHDSGAVAHNGLQEKHVTLSIALKIREILEEKGYKVLMTRSKDNFVTLDDRVDLGEESLADLFVSLHADSYTGKYARGASFYTISQSASDVHTAKLAEQENRAQTLTGVTLPAESTISTMLVDLVVNETKKQSSLFAETLTNTFKKENMPLLTNTHRYAGFKVLKSPEIPSVLIEVGFLSDKEEAELLRDADYKAELANAIAKAIISYCEKTNLQQH